MLVKNGRNEDRDEHQAARDNEQDTEVMSDCQKVLCVKARQHNAWIIAPKAQRDETYPLLAGTIGTAKGLRRRGQHFRQTVLLTKLRCSKGMLVSAGDWGLEIG